MSLPYGDMNIKQLQSTNSNKEFLEEQLFEARHALFTACSVREIKFLQTKIAYLSKQMKETKTKKK